MYTVKCNQVTYASFLAKREYGFEIKSKCRFWVIVVSKRTQRTQQPGIEVRGREQTLTKGNKM